MTNTLTMARPYAKAAFSVAKSVNQLSLWSKVLHHLSLAAQDVKMKSVLKNPSCTKDQLAELLTSFLCKVSGNGSANDFLAIKNFVKILSEKNRLSLLPSIAELFEENLAKESKYLSLTVTSAFSMDDQQQNQIKEKLSKQLDSALVIDFQIDASLIGGLLIRSGSWVMDGTVKGALTRLKSALM